MKNSPEKIYLQIGDEELHENDDFNKLGEVTWCKERIFPYDIEYVLASKNVSSVDSEEVDKAAMAFAKQILYFTDDLVDYNRNQYHGFKAGVEWALKQNK